MIRWAPLVLLAACTQTADVAPLGDYRGWKRLDTYGKAPGHGDTYRIIYVNDVAETGQYTSGTIFVKEVYNRVGDGPGALRVIEIMRRIDPGVAEDGGWLFTAASTPGGTETEQTFCWRRCHQAAPFDGGWFDYSK